MNIPRFSNRQIIYALVALAWIFSPLFLDNYQTDVLNAVGLYAILALSLNVILGYGGMFHMGHAAFYAIGAYTTAILSTQFGVPTLWTLPLAGILAGFFALIVARPIIHLRGDYLLIVTIGMVEIVRIAIINDAVASIAKFVNKGFILVGIQDWALCKKIAMATTNGPNGIFGVAPPTIFGHTINGIVNTSHYFYLITAFLALTILLFYLLEHSRYGRALRYLCSDEIAAEGSGVNTAGYKLSAFVIGAVWAGMAGTLYAGKITFISPSSFTFWESVVMFMIVILGGSGYIPGVILGALLVVGLPELFQGLQQYRMLIFGIVLVVMMVFRPQGILPPKPPKYPIHKVDEKEVLL
ncbi:MAG: branched-chain amino acid ABC transporter permease [Desulfatibacillum sp.]|nr:branched-chain amino acid ABC transporter permease [Desulfatibacillum sp.]